jgi:hypothetical protein
MNMSHIAMFQIGNLIDFDWLPDPVTQQRKASLKALILEIEAIAFPDTDTTLIVMHFSRAREWVGYNYDIRALVDYEAFRRGRVLLSSPNLGYDFALFNVPGRGKGQVRIYRSNWRSDEYELIGCAKNLASALRTVDKLYRDTARSHLP